MIQAIPGMGRGQSGLTPARRSDGKPGWLRLLFLVLLVPGVFDGFAWGQSAQKVGRQIESLVEDGQYREALDLAWNHLDLAAKNADLAVSVATLGLKAGAAPSDAGLLVVGAKLAVQRGDLQRARRLLEDAARIRPSDGETRYRLARVLFAEGADGEALVRAGEAVRSDPASTVYRCFYASLLKSSGQPEESLVQLEAARRLSPNDGRLLLQLADHERIEGRLSQAVEYLELAVRADPENPLYRRELSKVEAGLGWSEEAAESLRLAESLERAFTALSDSLERYRHGDENQAIERLTRVVDGNRDFTTGALALADLLQRRGRNQEALALYREILSRRDDCGPARKGAAWLLFLQGHQDEAIDLLRTREGEKTAGEEYLWARKNEGAGDWEQALDNLRRVEQRYPLDPHLMREVSRILNEAGRPRQALAYLERAYSLSPGDPQIEAEARRIRFDYALDQEEKGNWAAAQRVMERLVEERGDSSYLFHLAYCLQNRFRYRDAAILYREGLDREPAAEWARVNLAFCLFSDGAFDEAASVWEGLIGEERKPEFLYSLGLNRIRQFRSRDGLSLISEAADGGYEPAIRWIRRTRPH